MKNYLTNFFDEFNYKTEDSSFLMDIYESILGDTESLDALNLAIKMYDDNIFCDYEKITRLSSIPAKRLYFHEYSTELLFLICLTKRAKENYMAAGISEQIYHDSMLDLKYKMIECKLVKGVIGTFVGFWFYDMFRIKRFTFGRLQCLVKDFEEHYTKDGITLTPNTKVIDMHIPRDQTPLDEESCTAALRSAAEFFKGQYDEPVACVCHSWLLFPENENIIPKHTNIYKFFKRFDIVSWDYYKENLDLWRLFDTDEKVPERLPANNSVRRQFVEHLKNGGKTGWGYGVFFL